MGGPAQREFMPARAALLHIMGLVAGHWPHTLGLQPGGTTRAIGRAVQARLTGIVLGMRRFLEATLFGDALESVAALSNGAALNEWAQASGPGASDFGRFLAISEALGLGAIGRATDVFLSYGAYARERCAGLRARGLHQRHCKRPRSCRHHRRSLILLARPARGGQPARARAHRAGRRCARGL